MNWPLLAGPVSCQEAQQHWCIIVVYWKPDQTEWYFCDVPRILSWTHIWYTYVSMCVYVVSLYRYTHAQRFLGRHWTSLWAYSCFTSKHIWMCISSSTHTYVCIYILYLHILLVRTFQTLNLAEHFQGVHVRPHAIVCPCHELVSIYSSSSSSSPGAPSMCHGARVQIPFSVLNNCTSYGQTTVCVCVRVLLLIRLPENKHVAMYIHIQCMYAWLSVCLSVCFFYYAIAGRRALRLACWRLSRMVYGW